MSRRRSKLLPKFCFEHRSRFSPKTDPKLVKRARKAKRRKVAPVHKLRAVYDDAVATAALKLGTNNLRKLGQGLELMLDKGAQCERMEAAVLSLSIGRYRKKGPLQTLRAGLSDKDPLVRAAALRSICAVWWHAKPLLPELRELRVSDPIPAVRKAAQYTVMRVRGHALAAMTAARTKKPKPQPGVARVGGHAIAAKTVARTKTPKPQIAVAKASSAALPARKLKKPGLARRKTSGIGRAALRDRVARRSITGQSPAAITSG